MAATRPLVVSRLRDEALNAESGVGEDVEDAEPNIWTWWEAARPLSGIGKLNRALVHQERRLS